MNLASFYLCLFFSEAALKCYIVGKEENYKYLVALYTYHFYFFCFFFVVVVVSSLFWSNLRQEADVFIHTRLLRVNTITWKSKKNQQCVMLLNL